MGRVAAGALAACLGLGVFAPATVHAAKKREDDASQGPLKHRGTVIDVIGQATGCVGEYCRNQAGPGGGFDLFLGHNFLGIVELGLSGGAGFLRDRVKDGTNVFSLYGLDPAKIQADINMDLPAGQSLDAVNMSVSSVDTVSAHAGFDLRIHVIPRGRMGLFLRAGLGWEMIRHDYQTSAGAARMALHGVGGPLGAGLQFYLTPHIALVFQGGVRLSYYGIARIKTQDINALVPIISPNEATAGAAERVRARAGSPWEAGAGLRFRF